MGSWGVVRVRFGATVVLSILAGCGRLGFDAILSTDARGDGADTPFDTPLDGPTTFGAWSTPIEVTAMQTDAMDFGPTFSPDTLEVFVAQRDTGDADIFRFTRATPSSSFANRTNVTILNIAAGEEGEPSLSDDGLEIYFDRFSPQRIFTSKRSTLTATDWTPPVIIDSVHPALAGFATADFAGDLRMVVTRNTMIWESTRATASAT